MSMTHVYGHNRLVYNEEADALAKAGATLSKEHKPRGVRDMPRGNGEATRQKRMRSSGIKRQAAGQVSDDNTHSDRPGHIRHMCREMHNAPLDKLDPKPGQTPQRLAGTLCYDQQTTLSLHVEPRQRETSMASRCARTIPRELPKA